MKTNKKGSNTLQSTRPRYTNSPIRSKNVKDSVELLKTYAILSKGRLPTRDEKSAFIALSLPMAREEKK